MIVHSVEVMHEFGGVLFLLYFEMESCSVAQAGLELTA